MRVVLSYARNLAGEAAPFPETVQALRECGVEWEPNYTPGPTGYVDSLERIWREGRGFINVEQAKVPRPGMREALEACPEPWCAWAYNISTGYSAWTGFVKFADALVRATPDLFEAMDRIVDGTPRRYWGRVDTRLERVLTERGWTKHVHWPAILNLNPKQAFRGSYHCRCGAAVDDETARSGPPPHLCSECRRT